MAQIADNRAYKYNDCCGYFGVDVSDFNHFSVPTGFRIVGVKIDPFLFNNQGSILYLRVDCSDIFPNYSDKEQLHSGKEEDSYNHRRHTYLETLPEDKFVYKIGKGYQ